MVRLQSENIDSLEIQLHLKTHISNPSQSIYSNSVSWEFATCQRRHICTHPRRRLWGTPLPLWVLSIPMQKIESMSEKYMAFANGYFLFCAPVVCTVHNVHTVLWKINIFSGRWKFHDCLWSHSGNFGKRNIGYPVINFQQASFSLDRCWNDGMLFSMTSQASQFAGNSETSQGRL